MLSVVVGIGVKYRR